MGGKDAGKLNAVYMPRGMRASSRLLICRVRGKENRNRISATIKKTK
jgi:hypothetical protein